MEERTLVMLKPGNEKYEKEIRAILRVAGVYILREEKKTLTRHEVECLYPDKVGWEFFDELAAYLTSGASTLWVCGGLATVQKVLAVKGKTFSGRGIRGLYATDFIHNVFHCSDSRKEAEREIALFF